MASLGGVKIDPTQHDTDTQRGEYEDLPNGTYRLEVEAADVKISGEGSQRKVGLNTTIRVIEPEDYKDRKVFNYINLEHPTAKAQEIGQADFAKLLRAMGISEAPEDSDEIMFIAFTADIGMGKPSTSKNADGTPQYPAKNEIKKYYYPDEGNVPAPTVAAKQPANDNRRPPANDNKPANDTRSTGNSSAGPATGKARPWGAKK